MTGPAFENVYYKNNIAQGSTMQSYYMGVGGTNWGWLPATSSTARTTTARRSGRRARSAPRPTRTTSPARSSAENKLINDFETSVAPLTSTAQVAAPSADNPAVTTMARANPTDGTQFVYVRQADATSTATVSTHLALNLSQTSGYTYDDAASALAYTGTWTHAGPSSGYTNGDYDSTESWSQTAGDSMTVTFNGTAVQWIGPKNNNGGIAAVSIDGTQVATVDTYAAAGKEFQQVLFSKTGLAAGSHTLTIAVTGQKDAASSAATVVIDAINVPDRRPAGGLLPGGPAERHPHPAGPRLAAARRQLRLRRPASGLLHLRADEPGQHRRPHHRPAL